MYSFSRQWTSSSDAKIQVINIKVSGTLALHKISDCYCDRFYVFLIMKHFAHTWVGSCCQIMNKSCRLWSKWLVNPELQNSYLPRRVRSLQTPIKHILLYFIFIPQDLCSSHSLHVEVQVSEVLFQWTWKFQQLPKVLWYSACCSSACDGTVNVNSKCHFICCRLICQWYD